MPARLEGTENRMGVFCTNCPYQGLVGFRRVHRKSELSTVNVALEGDDCDRRLRRPRVMVTPASFRTDPEPDAGTWVHDPRYTSERTSTP